MKIYFSHSVNFDYKNELYLPLRQSPLNIQHQIFLPHESKQFINSKEIIKKSDLILAEVSYPSTGQGIELGWANDASTPIICIYKNGKNISNSLHILSSKIISYSSPQDMLDKITKALSAVKIP